MGAFTREQAQILLTQLAADRMWKQDHNEWQKVLLLYLTALEDLLVNKGLVTEEELKGVRENFRAHFMVEMAPNPQVQGEQKSMEGEYRKVQESLSRELEKSLTPRPKPKPRKRTRRE